MYLIFRLSYILIIIQLFRLTRIQKWLLLSSSNSHLKNLLLHLLI